MEIYENIILALFEIIISLLLLHGIMKHLHTNVFDKMLYIILASVLIAACNMR